MLKKGLRLLMFAWFSAGSVMCMAKARVCPTLKECEPDKPKVFSSYCVKDYASSKSDSNNYCYILHSHIDGSLCVEGYATSEDCDPSISSYNDIDDAIINTKERSITMQISPQIPNAEIMNPVRRRR